MSVSLYVVSWMIWLPGLVLALMEMARRPHWLICDCRTGWMAAWHLKPPWLLTVGICYVVSDIVGVAGGKRFPAVAMVGAYYLWRWWQHTKDGRKRLKDRVLGVVRATAAGLKVVPVSGGAR